MKKIFSKALALTLATLLLFSNIVIGTVAEDFNPAEMCPCVEPVISDEPYDVVAPTCGGLGYDLYICETCGGWVVKNYVPATGEHVYNIEEATCTEDQYCLECGEITAEAIGHNWVVDVKEETCTEDGYTTHTCLNCGESYVDSETAATGHDWKLVDSKDAGCYVDGYKNYVCGNCGEQKTEVLKAPMEHLFYEVDRIEATCTEGAYAIHVCNLCGEQLEVLEGPALGHDYVEYDGKAASCTEDGWAAYKECSRCGENDKEIISATGHTPAEPIIENEVGSDCTEAGSYDEVVYCSVCGEELSRETEVVKPKGHNHTGETVEENVVDATCTEGGSYDTVLYCVDCGAELIRTPGVTEALGHNYASKAFAATCIAPAYTVYTCTRCDDSYTEEEGEPDIQAHNGVVEGRVEATCTSEGSTGALTCTYCGKVLASAVVIPMKDHELVKTDAQAPTCTEIGWEAYEECVNCDYTTYEELAALGHEPGTTKGKVKPTCTEQGYTIHQCVVCGEDFFTDYVDALGHDYVDFEANPSDCINDGWYAYHECSRCGDSNYEVDPADGHSIEYVEAQASTCVDAGWEAYEYCTVCDYSTKVELDLADCIPAEAVVENEVAETCTTAGSYDLVVYCSVCNEELERETVVVEATGHVEADAVIENNVDPTCTEPGSYDLVIYCSVCGEELSRDTMVADATGHTEVVNAAIAPTETSIGWTEEVYCSVCGVILEEREPVDESVTFTYEATGINGVDQAVNSGYIFVDVYLNVNTEFARIYGVDLAMAYSNGVKYDSGVSGLFNTFSSNSYNDGSGVNVVKLTSDMGMTEGTKVLAQGSYHFATLKFKVNNDFSMQDACFDVILEECELSRDTTLENDVIVDYGVGTNINVTTLGDADNDGKITTDDANLLYEWFLAKKEYDIMYIFDMDKNGAINGDDFAYLRGAIVYDDAYLLV